MTQPAQPKAPPSVSVIIPAYNAARFLERAVDSALAQTGIATPQVVIVDDGSTDDTARVIADLAARHPTLEGHANPENMGPADTRNHAISKATGDWIAILDADDAFAPGRCARLLEVAQAQGFEAIADLLVLYDLAADSSAPQQMPASGAVERLGFKDFLQTDVETKLDFGLLKPMFRRSLAESGQWRYPSGVRHGEDAALYIALTRAGVAFGLLREGQYLFSTRIGAISGKYSPGSVTDVNYLAVAAQLRALREQLAREGVLDVDLETLLEDRIVAALRQNRIYGWTTLRKRDWARLRRWLAQDPANRQALWRVLRAKAMGHRGLPN